MRQAMRRPGPVGPMRPMRPIGPPRAPVQNNFESGQMPGLQPPKGIIEQLNRAKLKDFMALGQFLLHRRVHA